MTYDFVGAAGSSFFFLAAKAGDVNKSDTISTATIATRCAKRKMRRLPILMALICLFLYDLFVNDTRLAQTASGPATSRVLSKNSSAGAANCRKWSVDIASVSHRREIVRACIAYSSSRM